MEKERKTTALNQIFNDYLASQEGADEMIDKAKSINDANRMKVVIEAILRAKRKRERQISLMGSPENPDN